MFVQKGVLKRLFLKWKEFLRQQRCWYAASVILMLQKMEVYTEGLIRGKIVTLGRSLSRVNQKTEIVGEITTKSVKFYFDSLRLLFCFLLI